MKSIGHEKKTVQQKKMNYYWEALWCILSLNSPFQTNKITWCEYYAVFRSHAHYGTGLCRIIRQDADFLAFFRVSRIYHILSTQKFWLSYRGIGIILTLNYMFLSKWSIIARIDVRKFMYFHNGWLCGELVVVRWARYSVNMLIISTIYNVFISIS